MYKTAVYYDSAWTLVRTVLLGRLEVIGFLPLWKKSITVLLYGFMVQITTRGFKTPIQVSEMPAKICMDTIRRSICVLWYGDNISVNSIQLEKNATLISIERNGTIAWKCKIKKRKWIKILNLNSSLFVHVKLCGYFV